MRCPYCHHSLNRTAAYCPHCGKSVAQNSCSSEQINLKAKSIPMRWVALFVFLILLLIGGLSFFLLRQKTPLDSSFDTYTEINQKLSSIEKPYLDEEGFISSEDSKILLEEVFAYIQTLYEQGMITDCSYTDGDTAVYYQIDNWLGCLYFPQIKDMLSGASGDVQIVTIEPYHSNLDMWFNSKFAGFLSSIIKAGKVLNTDDVANKLVQYSENFVYKQDYHDEEATIDLLYNLNLQNSILIWQGHGGYLEKFGSLLSLNAKKWKPTDFEAHQQEFTDDALLLCSNDVVAVTSLFFEKELADNSLKNSLIYLNTCASLKDHMEGREQKSLAQTILDRGASCVIGNTDSVNIWYAYAMQDTIFDALQSRSSDDTPTRITEAINTALDLWGHNSDTAYVWAVGTDITLDDLLTPSVKDNDSSLSTPLSAADVNWIVEPTYDYDDVEPIYSYLFDHYTGEPLQDDRYSIYDNYYLITRGDTYSLYEMNSQSEYSDWLTVEVYPNGASDIVTYETKESRIGFYRAGLDNYSYSTILPDPWQGIGSTIPHGSSIAAIIYDTAQDKSIYVCESEMEIYTEEVSDIQEKNLEKPYPILQVDDIELTSNRLPYYFMDNYESHYASGIGGAAMFAYVSPTGKILTDFKFDQAVGFSDGLGACTVDGKWGYIDENGTAVTDFIYDGTMDVDYTYETDDTGSPKTITCAYPCTCDTMVVSRNGQMGLLYRDGTTLLDFGEFEDLAPAYDDQLWAKQNGLWGLIDLAALKEKAHLST